MTHTAETKHTTGPWYYAKVMESDLTRPYERFEIFHETPPNYDNNYGVNVGSKKVFLGVLRARANKLETEANARLIAAAPDLLAELRRILNCDRGTSGRIILECEDEARITDLIAKATIQEM